MKLVLSGFAGVGKSSIVDLAHDKYKGVFICPESAREVNYTKEFYNLKNDKENEFFQKSVMDNEIMKVIISHMNGLNHVLYDRCIIDNFAFAEIFYGSDKVNYNKFESFITETCEKYNVETLYDSILFIHSTENEDFIRDNILNDNFRKETTSHDVKEFIKKSKEWETIYFDIFDKIDGIAKNIIKINHFIDNEKYDSQVKDTLEFAFKI
jgi:hypothetical protein